jgi:hypothetical protein
MLPLTMQPFQQPPQPPLMHLRRVLWMLGLAGLQTLWAWAQIQVLGVLIALPMVQEVPVVILVPGLVTAVAVLVAMGLLAEPIPVLLVALAMHLGMGVGL